MRLINIVFIISMLFALSGIAAGQTSDIHGMPIDEAYRQNFATCDSSDRFEKVQFPIRKASGAIAWYGCKSDPSRFSRFERKPAAGGAPEAIVIESKLAHDKDGSPAACNTPGKTDQCGTSLMLKPTAQHPCPNALRHLGTHCLPVDASAVPYVVLPGGAPAGIDGAAFRHLSGLALGDVGIVVANGKRVPVIIADMGPAYKIGEGSTALLKALSTDGKPRSIAKGVLFILFPKSALGNDPSAEDLSKMVSEQANKLYGRLNR